MHISSVRLLGQLKVEGSELRLFDCTIENAPQAKSQLVGLPMARALDIRASRVVLTKTTIHGHSSGAINLDAAASLVLIGCALRANQAETGAALLIAGGSSMMAQQSLFSNNSATRSGGALQVRCHHAHHLCKAYVAMLLGNYLHLPGLCR